MAAVSARRRASVRRLHVTDPYNKNSTATVATFSAVADQFTNNPNVLYDPSKAPGSVRRLSVAQPEQAVSRGDRGRAERSHGKVFKPNRQTLFGGKTLKRY